MTRHRRFLFPTLLAIFLSVPALPAGAAARWEPLPLYGGNVEVTAAPSRPSTLYAATPAAGLFRSTDRGESWHFVAYGPDRKRVRILGVDPRDSNRLYAALLWDGYNPYDLFRSGDGGKHWQRSRRGMPVPVQAIAFDPRDSARIYAATSNGLFFSSDRGDTWSQLALRHVSLLAVALAPGHPDVILVSDYTSGGRQVQRSEDGGRTFVPVAEQSVDGFVFDPVRPGRVYGFNILATVRSDDLGATWTRLEANNLLKTLAITPAGVLLAGTWDFGVIRSLDGGETWSPAPGKDSRPFDAVSSLAVLRDRVVAGGTRGVWRGTLEGRGWQAASDGLQAQSVSPLAVAPDADSSLYVGVWRGLFVTRDTGATFQYFGPKLGVQPFLQILDIHPRQPQIAYAWGCCAPNGGGVMRTDDGGLHWRALPYNGVERDFQVLAVDPVDPDIVYAGGYLEPHSSPCTALRSLDAGETWSCMRPPGVYDFSDLAFDPRDSRVLYGLFGTAQQLYRSVDRGVHWTHVPANAAASEVWQIEIDPLEPSRLYGTGGYSGVFRSDDGGRTWKRKNPGAGLQALVHDFLVDASRPGRIYVALEVFHEGDTVGTGQVFRSDDAGDHWEAMNDGLPGGVVLDLAADPRGAGVLYAGTAGQGLYRLRVED